MLVLTVVLFYINLSPDTNTTTTTTGADVAVVEKLSARRLAYIKKLEDGSLALTPDEEQQHLSQVTVR